MVLCGKPLIKKSRQEVALKKIVKAFQNQTDAQRTFREIMFLQELHRHKNIVRLQNVLKADNDEDIYVVFDLMETDLHAVIRMNVLQEIHKKYIVYQILKAMKYIHSGEVLHRDLKPSNILLNSECHVKVADFGLARSIAAYAKDGYEGDGMEEMTDYVATRWYRAPEILLGAGKYTKAVDVWSIGCILAELLGGKPIFPGSSTLNQLGKIIDATGFPSQDDIDAIHSPHAMTLLESLSSTSHGRPISYPDLYPQADEDAIDMLKKMLYFNPYKRMTVDEALEHPFVADFHDPSNEHNFPGVIQIPIDDNTKFSIDDYRSTLYEQIKRKEREQKQERKERQKAKKEQKKLERKQKKKGNSKSTSKKEK